MGIMNVKSKRKAVQSLKSSWFHLNPNGFIARLIKLSSSLLCYSITENLKVTVKKMKSNTPSKNKILHTFQQN